MVRETMDAGNGIEVEESVSGNGFYLKDEENDRLKYIDEHTLDRILDE